MECRQTEHLVRLHIAQALRAARQRAGYGISDFARASGWGRQYIHHVESQGTTTIETVVRWCSACGPGVDPFELLRGVYAAVDVIDALHPSA